MSTANEGSLSSKKILIVDDDRAIHVMLGAVLSAHGFVVLSAMTGEDGLRLASLEKPDLIILDVIMPTMKGREVCRKIKENPETGPIPVLFLTAKNSEDDVQAEMAIGAVGHVTKPINSALLVKLIEKVLGS